MFGASSELASNMFGASSELASVMEFGFNRRHFYRTPPRRIMQSAAGRESWLVQVFTVHFSGPDEAIGLLCESVSLSLSLSLSLSRRQRSNEWSLTQIFGTLVQDDLIYVKFEGQGHWQKFTARVGIRVRMHDVASNDTVKVYTASGLWRMKLN